MSDVKQMADEEAARAEAEPDVSFEEPEPEPEPDEPDEPVDTRPAEEQAAAFQKRLEQESRRHEKALERIWAEGWADFVLCPLCVGDGFLRPYTAGQIADEQLEAIDALSGRIRAPELFEDSDYTVCPNCHGRGSTKITADDGFQVTKFCDKCGNKGFMPKAPVLPSLPQPAPLNGQQLPTVAPSWGGGAPDAWGRAAGHPHFGIDPALIGLTG